MFKISNQYGLYLCVSSVKTVYWGVIWVLRGPRSDAPFLHVMVLYDCDAQLFLFVVFWGTIPNLFFFQSESRRDSSVTARVTVRCTYLIWNIEDVAELPRVSYVHCSNSIR
jgi:hypothetical protein